MSFDIHDTSKQEGAAELFFGDKQCSAEKIQDENSYHNSIVVPKDLFESIEGHYLPELVVEHDELLDSLVAKGCEDNQILGHAFDKLAHLVSHGGADYNEDDEDMLLNDAPVTGIIDRLEQSMSPGQNSITAAQGLLNLQQISDHLVDQQIDNENLNYSNDNFHTKSSECLPEPQLELSSTTQADTIVEINGIIEEQPAPDQEMHPQNLESVGNAPEDSESAVEHKDDAAENTNIPLDDDDICNLEQNYNNSNKEIEQVDQLVEEDDNIASKDFPNNEEPAALSETNEGYVSPDSQDDNPNDLPTDLSYKEPPATEHVISRDAETTEITDNMSEKSDELPKDLTCRKRAETPITSPKQLEIPRPPSRESDAMQSPQPSGIPAVPSSPELFTAPQSKTNKSLFLETLLASPSPKMCFSSELTITKYQSEPLNLGKNRKSASPTVSSCSDEIKKVQKEYGEPEEKRIKKESAEAQAKSGKCSENSEKLIEDSVEMLRKKPDKPVNKNGRDEVSPLKQLKLLKISNDFTVPDPLLVPKDKLNDIITSPGREIPALLLKRPELRLPEAFAFPAVLQDPDILVISLSQLENILENKCKKPDIEAREQRKDKEHKAPSSAKSTSSSESGKSATPSDGPPKQIPSMEALAGDIDAATSAALSQMLWLPYLSQIEAAVACSQNADFLKALNTSGYGAMPPSGYPDLAQMFSPNARFMKPPAFPMMPQMDYNNQLEFAMWQDAMNQNNNATAQRNKQSSVENHLKEISKAVDAHNPYLQASKSISSRSHSAARTSPIAHNYNIPSQRSINHANQFFPGMYPGMNTNVRANASHRQSLQMPWDYNTNMMAAAAAAQQRSRSQHQQKSPSSPFYHNNNYLQSLKQHSSSRVSHSPTQKRSESTSDSRPPSGHRPPSRSSSAEDSQKPRISVRSLQNLLEPSSQAQQQAKRHDYLSYHPSSLSELMTKPPFSHENAHSSKARRQAEQNVQRRMLGHDEAEVGSTTAHEDAVAPTLHPDHQTHLWHPLFGNQKGYSSPWNWTTVTVNGD